MFAVSFDEIAPIVGRSSTAARQLASRARRRVQGVATVPESISPASERLSTPSWLPRAAATSTRFLAVLDPDVVSRTTSMP